MGIFGWSLPPGCSTLPGEEPEPVQPRCACCGAFLPYAADSWETREHWEEDYDDRKPAEGPGIRNVTRVRNDGYGFGPLWAFERRHDYRVLKWTCRNCGATLEESDY